MERWWSDHDAEALRWLLARKALYSGTRTLNNAVGAYGEYLASRALRARRLAQAAVCADAVLDSGRRVQIKATSNPGRGWLLGYGPPDLDYALVRFTLPTWAVGEAWFVPHAVALEHALPGGRLPARGDWQRDRRVRRLALHRY